MTTAEVSYRGYTLVSSASTGNTTIWTGLVPLHVVEGEDTLTRAKAVVDEWMDAR